MIKKKAMPNVELLRHDTYVGLIQNSIGAKLFQNLFAKVNGKKMDILKGGEFSCAFYVSSLLVIAGFMKKPHATVKSTQKDLEASGWKRAARPKYGDILIWEATDTSKMHEHIGFYGGADKAISNSDTKHMPVLHHMYYGLKKGKPNRKITAVYSVPKN
jgi:hypothetical protein